ncbi:MAG: hypothetical protein GVY27_11445 [Deinococcus-Thermus bacterium]|jgi:Cu+-exporting ATPase|nr:hypothetical protein [Deinococcota bacterium]
MTETTLHLTGLSCASCVARAESALAGVDGVEDARVNLATRKATVTHGASVARADLAAAVASAGYPAEDESEDAGADAADGRAAEAAALRRDVLIAGALTLPVLILEMGGHLIPAFHAWQMEALGTFPARVIQFVLATAVLAGPGALFFRSGIPALLRGAPEMNALVALGTGAAWAYSTLVTFGPTLLPETARAVYFEPAAVIVTLILLGRWLESRAAGRASCAGSERSLHVSTPRRRTRPVAPGHVARPPPLPGPPRRRRPDRAADALPGPRPVA